jgi:hypothetical protein
MTFYVYWCLAGNFREWSIITSNNHPSKPQPIQQPVKGTSKSTAPPFTQPIASTFGRHYLGRLPSTGQHLWGSNRVTGRKNGDSTSGLWINTYRYIFSGMNIHKSQLFWCSLGFWPIPSGITRNEDWTWTDWTNPKIQREKKGTPLFNWKPFGRSMVSDSPTNPLNQITKINKVELRLIVP